MRPWRWSSARSPPLTVRVRVRVALDLGDSAMQLDELALKRGAGLIVVGTRGASRLRSALLGSVSGRLASNARTPVMVVSEKARLEGLPVGSGVHATA